MEQDQIEEIICTRSQRRKQGPKLDLSGSKVKFLPVTMPPLLSTYNLTTKTDIHMMSYEYIKCAKT